LGQAFRSIIEKHEGGDILKNKILESFQGWQAYARWANSFGIIKEIANKISFSV